MPLPNISGQQGRRAPVGTQAAPGTRVNKDQEQTPWKNFIQSSKSTIRENLSVGNTVNQGMYSAFGNNPLTRIASGMMGNVGGFLGSMTGKEEESPEAKGLKAIKESIDSQKGMLQEQLSVLNDILVATKEAKSEKVPLRRKKVTSREKLDLDEEESTDIALRDRVKIYRTGGPKKRPRRTNKKIGFDMVTGLDDVKEAIDSKRNESPVTILKDISKTLTGVSSMLMKFMAGYQQDRLTSAENSAEAARSGKYGKFDKSTAVDVPYKDETGLPELPGGGGGMLASLGTWLAGAWAAIKLAGKDTLDFIKGGYDKMKVVVSSMYESTSKWFKDIFNSASDWVKKTGSSVLEKGKGLADDAGKLIKTKADEALEAVGDATKKYGGKALSGTGGILKKAAGPLAAIFEMFDAYAGVKEAKNIFGVQGRDATLGENMAAAYGGAIQGLSFDTIKKEDTAKWLHGLFSDTEKQNSEVAKLLQSAEEMKKVQPRSSDNKSNIVVAPSTVNNNTSVFPGFNKVTNDDSSVNRYFDRHYAF